MTIYGVDAHATYQAGFQPGRLASEGFGFALYKLTQGVTGYGAPAMVDAWIRQTRAAGVIPGVYHWLTSASGTAQADRLVSRIRSGGHAPEEMLIAIDVEDTAAPPPYSVVVDCFNRLKQLLPGHPILLYTGAWWWQPRGWNGAGLTDYLWLSRYVGGSGYASSLYAGVPASWWTPSFGGWPKATMLQYSSRGTACGITSNIDVNAFTGTPAQLAALARVPTAAPATPRWEISMILARNGATIVLTDWNSWHDQSITYDRCMAMQQAGVPMVDVTAEEISAILALPAPRTGAGGSSVTMSTDDRVAIATQVASEVAPYLRNVNAIADRLGAAGDALGTLNDSE